MSNMYLRFGEAVTQLKACRSSDDLQCFVDYFDFMSVCDSVNMTDSEHDSLMEMIEQAKSDFANVVCISRNIMSVAV